MVSHTDMAIWKDLGSWQLQSYRPSSPNVRPKRQSISRLSVAELKEVVSNSPL